MRLAIPKFDELFGPVLRILASGETLQRQTLIERVQDELALSESERDQVTSTGRSLIRSRIAWSMEFLSQAKAVERPKRGQVKIAELGRKLLSDKGDSLRLADIRELPGIVEWRQRSRTGKRSRGGSEVEAQATASESDSTPLELIESALDSANGAVAGELLERLIGGSFQFFERTVLSLLLAMGYGATADALEHLGGPGDEGVDGVIHQDRLGLDEVFVQAKRYAEDRPIGRPVVQGFVGALTGKGANKGVFFTTSSFSPDAIDYTRQIKSPHVILIGGAELTRLMIEHSVGVTVDRSFELVSLDENFFEDSI
jgi:restriction system protein